MSAHRSTGLLEPNPDPTAASGRGSVTRVLVSAGLLLLVYVGLSFINDSGATLGADEGAKVATLKVMGERGTFSPDVPYWAATWDPAGTYHGLYATTRIGDSYINITTLPMILAAKPLWSLGGYRAALLLPMLGGVASALAARSLARRLASAASVDRAGDWAFWLVGLASPVTIYALDLWEHTLGLAAMAWGVVLLVDAAGLGRHGPPAAFVTAAARGSDTGRHEGGPPRSTGSGPDSPEIPETSMTSMTSTVTDADGREPTGARPAWLGLAAGACFGLAASMRTEAIAYLVITVAVAAFAAGFPRRWARPLAIGAGALAGFGALFVANVVLEWAVLGEPIRSTRAGVAAGAGGQDLVGRFREGITTLVALAPSSEGVYLAYGVIFAVGVGVWALAAAGRLPRMAEVVAIVVVLLVLLQRIMDGAGFFPGLFATTPLAAVGLFLGWRRPDRWIVLMAIVPLPFVFLFQFPGGALPQWGGRYILLSGFLLGVVGIIALVEMPRPSRLGLAGLAVIVTAIGLVFFSQRTHAFAAAGDVLAQRPEDVLISPDAFPPREFGSTWGAKRWLSSVPSDLPAMEDVARQSGARTFAVVQLDPDGELPAVAGYHEVGRSQIPLLGGSSFTVVSYQQG